MPEHLVWPGVVEHLYLIPILWAAWRGDLIGGSLAGLSLVFAVWWIPLQRPTDAESLVFPPIGAVFGKVASKWRGTLKQTARLKSELRHRNELMARSGKLTAAGELAAGLAHELRHPVASFVRPATPQFASIRPQDAIDGALALVKLAAPSADVKFRPEIDDNLVSLTCDPELMRHALINLLLNAMQAMSAGGVVTIRATRASGTVRIEVIDDGRGIAPELADKVLLPFVTTRPDGIGLGLAIAKQIAMQYGGQLEAEPNLGRGMTFRRTLLHSEEGL